MVKPYNYLLDGRKRPYSSYVNLTLNCNSRCKHCYIEAGPERKESMPMELRAKVIDELAKSKIHTIEFSGGEPTVEMDKLVDTLEYASETHKRTGYPKKVWLQTNAYFLRGRSKDEIEKELEFLKLHGANALDITSKDCYHSIELSELKKIKKIAKEVFGAKRVDLRGAPVGIVPIGRARDEVPLENWRRRSCSLYKEYGITVSVDGGVYPCCWQATPEMGNLWDESLSEIFEHSRKPDSLFRKLAKKGFSKVKPEELGLQISKEEFDRMVEKEGDCATCYQFYLPMKKKSPQGQ